MKLYRTNKKWEWKHKKAGPMYNTIIQTRMFTHKRRVALFGLCVEWSYDELIFS